MYATPYYQPYWLNDEELEHYGVLGMKWGIRRYQNKDGTLTAAGKKRYAGDTPEQIERSERRKAKVVKGVKTAVKIGAKLSLMAAIGMVGVSALSTPRYSTTVGMGANALNTIANSGVLTSQEVSDLYSNTTVRSIERGLNQVSSRAGREAAYGSAEDKAAELLRQSQELRKKYNF